MERYFPLIIVNFMMKSFWSMQENYFCKNISQIEFNGFFFNDCDLRAKTGHFDCNVIIFQFPFDLNDDERKPWFWEQLKGGIYLFLYKNGFERANFFVWLKVQTIRGKYFDWATWFLWIWFFITCQDDSLVFLIHHNECWSRGQWIWIQLKGCCNGLAISRPRFNSRQR